MEKIIKALVDAGAPWGLLCAILLLGILVLWRRNVQLTDKLYELGMSMTKANAKARSAIYLLRDDVKELIRKL